jgi:plasmid stabilization system protein ParE
MQPIDKLELASQKLASLIYDLIRDLPPEERERYVRKLEKSAAKIGEHTSKTSGSERKGSRHEQV